MPAIDEYLRRSHDAAVGSLCQWLSIPSIATDPSRESDMHRAAGWVQRYLDRVGVKAEIWPTAGWPAVYGGVESRQADAPTVLIYGHYDVQPPGELSRWSSPPFQPRVDPAGRIFARGAADNKGQLFAQLRAVEAWMACHAAPPVHVKFLIEGEEEIGSPNLPSLLASRRQQLRCDVVVVSDTPLWRANRPAISLGTRGITGLEVTVTGPIRDLHSGIFGGSVPNPIAVLTRMLASLHDERGRVAVPGFYDEVRPIPPDLRAQWKRLEEELAEEPADIGCPFAGEEGFGTLERRWLRPTLEFNGIFGGYSGPGSNTIVPSAAGAKITCRLVPDQQPDRIAALVADHLRAVCPPTVRLDLKLRKSGAPPYSIDPAHPALAAAERVLQEVYGVRPVRVREGLSLPILPMFKQLLGADTVLLGFCDPRCNAHSFDEFFDSADLLRGSIASARYLGALAEIRR